MNKPKIDFPSILKNREFDSLSVTRVGKSCCLIVTYESKTHVYTNEKGKRIEYRNVWQIKELLKEKYGFEERDLDFQIDQIKY